MTVEVLTKSSDLRQLSDIHPRYALHRLAGLGEVSPDCRSRAKRGTAMPVSPGAIEQALLTAPTGDEFTYTPPGSTSDGDRVPSD